MEPKNKLPDGLNFTRPREGSPEFVKGKLGLNTKRLLAWLNANNLEGEWLNFDLLESKEKKTLYFKLNDWKATAVGSTTPKTALEREFDTEKVEYPQRPEPKTLQERYPNVPMETDEAVINPDDIPF